MKRSKLIGCRVEQTDNGYIVIISTTTGNLALVKSGIKIHGTKSSALAVAGKWLQRQAKLQGARALTDGVRIRVLA